MPTAHLNGTEIFYTASGDGICCLVMHGGLGQDHTYMHPWLDPLSDVMRLVYYDHRGNGRSGRPDISTITIEQLAADADALREHLGFEQVALMGNSFGGFVALQYALSYPDRVSHLILLDTVADTSYGEEIIANAVKKGATNEMLAEIGVSPPPTDAEFERHVRIISPLYFHSFDPDFFEGMMQRAVHCASAYSRNGVLLPRYNLLPCLPEISVPTLIVVGEDDFITPPSQSRKMHAAIPGSRLAVIEQAGHYAHVEQSEVVCGVIRDWLLGVS